MSDTRKVQLETVVDPTGAQQGFKQVEDAAVGMAAKVGQSAGAAGKAVDGIGEGGQQAAGKVDRSAKSIIASIERTTAALKAGERGSSAYFEILAQQRGVSADVLAPYIADLRRTEEAQRAARASLQGMGVSAAQTAAALRGVPAQFTDIVTSIASGQQPLTVLLQQGGQLKDMFGGVGAAARALGGYVVGLVNPFTLAAAAAAGIGLAYRAGAAEADEFRRTLILSGQAAGVTAGQLSEMAAAIRAAGAGTQARASEVLAGIADSADIGRESLQRFVVAALQMERAGGQAAEKTADAFRSLAKDPLQAALKLNEATNFLTRGTYEQIRALEQQGRTADAAKVAQQAYADSIESRTPQMVGSLGYIERAWLAIKSATLGAIDAAKDVGRGNTLEGQIEAVRKRLESARTGIYSRDQVPQLQQELALLQEQQRLLNRGAEASAARLAAVKATAQWDSESDKYLSKQAQQAREIARAEQVGLAAGKSRAEVEALIVKIREKYAEKPGAAPKLPTFKAEEDAARAYMRALDGLQDIQAKATAGSEGLSKTQAKLLDVQRDPAWATYSRQQREQIITQAAASQAAEDQAAAVKAGAKVAAEAARDYQQWLDALGKSGDAVARQVQALQDEEVAARIAATGRLSLKAAIEEVTIARLRDAQVAAMGNPDAVAAIEREIQQREKLRDLLQGQDMRKAADEAAKEWARASEKINDTITDALMRGFESGKGSAQALRDTVVNMFKSMVLRPVIQAIVQPVAGQLAGAIGGFLGGGAQGSIVGQAANAYQLFGAGAGIFGTSAAYGAALGTTSIGAGSQAAMLASQTGVFGAEGAALTAAAAGNTATASALSTLGAAAPYLAAALAVAALAKSLDNSGTLHTGAASSYSAAGGLKSGLDLPGLGFGNLPAYSAETAGLTGGLAKSIASLLDSTATAFGKQAGYSAAAGFADDTSRDGSWGALLIGRMGQTLTNWEATRQSRWAPREFADGQAGLQQYLTAVSKDVRSALDGIGLPTWATEMLDSIGGSPTIEELATVVAQVGAVQQALVGLGYSMPQLATLTGAAVNALVQGFGGAQAMMQSAASYVEAFYSDAERTAIGVKQLRTELVKLGVDDLPATREAYRKLVESQDLTTESGRQLFAGLMNLSPAFAAVTQAVEAANAAIEAEITRLRGTENSTISQAEMQARFAVAMAQARAGDAKAREALPALSQAMEAAAQQTATSAADLARVRAWLASSLSETIGAASPGVVQSSAAGPAGAMSSAGDTQTARQLSALSDRIGLLEEPMRASALSAARTARLLERVMPEGDALTVRVAP